MKRKAIYVFLPLIAVLLITTIQAAPFMPDISLPFDQREVSPTNPVDISPINPVDISPINPVDISPINPVDTSPINPIDVSPINRINMSHIGQGMPGLANPAATYCVNHGGSLRYEETSEGTVGYCVLPDGTTCEEWAFYNGECGASNNPTPKPKPGCDKIVIQGKVTSIDQYRDYTIHVDEVLQGYGFDGTYPGFKLVPGVTVETTPVASSFVSINVGDCVEVSGKWCTTDSPPVYLGDPGTYVKKITCSSSPNPSCTPGPTGNCKCLNGEIWKEYQKDDCTTDWTVAEDCRNRGPNWSCENCECVETHKIPCDDRECSKQSQPIGNPYFDKCGNKVQLYSVCECRNDKCDCSGREEKTIKKRKNRPPNEPQLLGPKGKLTSQSGQKGVPITFSVSAKDSDGDMVTYKINWGDGTTSELGPVASGTSMSDSHIWRSSGNYKVKAIAIDQCDEESPSSCKIDMSIWGG